MFERVAGELRATLGVDSAAMCARAGDEACGAKARSGRVSRHSTEPPISDKRRRCGGRRRGLAGFQGTAPSHRSATSAAGVEGAGGTGGHGRASRSTTPSEARVWRSRGRPGPTAPGTPAVPHSNNTGPDGERAGRPRGGRNTGGARNTSGATQQQHGAWTASGRAGCAAAGDLSGEQATTAGFTRPRGGQPRT